MRWLLLLVSLFFCQFICFCQGEANHWYFGKNIHIDFSNGTASVDHSSAMSATEGCASISDKNGLLLFYTDGVSVWDRFHQVMPNGTGLYGNATSTQSGVIVPLPLNDSLFYVFTVDSLAGSRGLRCSVVNLKANNGYGDIILKNIPLFTPVCEKIAAVKHCNNRDVWVITHGWNSTRSVYCSIPAAIACWFSEGH